MRRFLAWVAVATALLASKASAVDNHLSGAYDSKRVTTSAPSEAPKKATDDKTWLRRESATIAPHSEEAPSPYTEAATTAPTPVQGGEKVVKYEGDVTAVIIPWEARGVKSSGYSSSKAPTTKPERNDVVEGGDVYGATARPTTDEKNDSQPRDSAVPVQVNKDNGLGWQSKVDDKTDRAWYQRTSAPEPATKTSSPYTDAYGDKTSSPTSDSTSAVKSVRNAENAVDRRESEDSRDDKTEGHPSLDDEIESSYKTSIPRPVSGKPSDVYAEKEAAPFDEAADSSASYAPTGRATYKWGMDTSESRGHSKKGELKKDVAAEDYAQTADEGKETHRHHSISGSLDYNGKADAPRVDRAGSSSSHGEDSADSVDAESRGYRNTNAQASKTKPGRSVQDGEYNVGIDTKDRGDTGSRDDHQWHERHHQEREVPEPSYDESAGQLPTDDKIKSPHEKAGPSNSHAAEDPYDENASIPSQEHSASSSLEKSSDVYAEKGAAPFADEETPYSLTGQEKRERGIAAATFPWGKKSSKTEASTEPHGYHAEGLKTDAAVEKDSEDSMQADQYNEKVKETHRDDLVPESLDDDEWSFPYKSTDRSAALRKDASTTPVYSEEASRPGKTKVPGANSPYDDSEDVKRESYSSTATFGEHSNALHHSQYDAEGPSASKAATDGAADEVAKDNDDSESPPLRLKRRKHIRDGEYGSAGDDAKVTEDIDADPEDQQYSSEPTRKRRGGEWHKSIDGNIEVPYEQSTAPVESETTSSSYKEADSRYEDKTSSRTTAQSSAASSETASPPYSGEMTPTYDDKTNPPPGELPSALSEDSPKPPKEQASSESSSASSGVIHDKGMVGVTVPWKAEASKAVTYSSTDAPTSPPEYHEKTEAKSAVYRDTLGPVIPWNGGKPQLVREQTDKPKLGSGGTESGVYSDEVAKRASRGNSHTLDDLVPWSGDHALLLRGLESDEQPEENQPEEEPTDPPAEESAELPEDKTPDEKPVETPAEESVEHPEENKPEEEPTETPAEEPAELPVENKPESTEQPEDKKPEEAPTDPPAEEPVEDNKTEEEPVEPPVGEPVEGAEVEESDGLMQATTVGDENVRWDQDDCDPCEVPTLPPTLPPIYPHANDDYTEHLPNVSDVHEAWKELKENAPSGAPTKPPRKKAPKPCKEDLKHCVKVIGEDGERYECEHGYTLTPTEQPTEGPTEAPSTESPPSESPTETPTERPTETPSTETPTERPYENETATPGTSEPTPAPSQPSESDEPTPAPSTPSESEPTPAPLTPSESEPTPAPSTPSESEPTPAPTESYDEPEPTPAASTTEGDISTPSPTATAASTTVKPASTTEAPSATTTGTTTTSHASAADTAYATGTSTTGEDANANAVGASTSESNTSSGSSALSGGAIAGIVIACVALAAVVVGAVLYKQRAIARQREENLFADLSAAGGRALETDYAAM